MLEEMKAIKGTREELKSFGILLGSIILIFTGIHIWKHGEVSSIGVLIGAFFVLIGALIPNILAPLYKVWMSIALVISKVISTILLAFLFYFCITPIGIIMRLSGTKFLKLDLDKNQESYWEERKNVEISKESFINQF